MLFSYLEGKKKFHPSFIKAMTEQDENTVTAAITSVDVPHAVDDAGTTLLHLSAKCGYGYMSGILIGLKCNVNAQDINGKTPLILAVENLDFSNVMTMVLIGKANIFLQDHRGQTALKIILTHPPSLGVDSIKYLLFECLKSFKAQKTAKILKDAECPIYDALHLKTAKVVRYMVANGCDINYRSPHDGTTAVHIGAVVNCPEMLDVVIELGADVTIKDNHGYTPFIHSISQDFNTSDLKSMHRRFGGKVNWERKNKRTGAFESRTVLIGGSKQTLKLFFEMNKLNLNLKDNNKATPMHYLAMNPHTFHLDFLRKEKLDLASADANGSTPLHLAAAHGYYKVVEFFLDLQGEADVNAIDHKGKTPIFYMLMSSSTSKDYYVGLNVISLLLHRGANVQVETPEGLTIFDLVKKKDKHIVDWFEPPLARLALLEAVSEPISSLVQNQIKSIGKFKNYFDLCRKQLQKMKKVIIFETVTLFDMLIARKENIADYATRNAGIILKIKWSSIPCRYYRFIIEKHIRNTISLAKLVNTDVAKETIKSFNEAHDREKNNKIKALD